MSTSAASTQGTAGPYAEFAPQASDDPEDVLFSSLFGLRTITLNRPKKLNSLNASMIRKIVPRLLEWEKSDMANVVVIKGAGDKAFCAGGDVAALAGLCRQGVDGQRQAAYYFNLEYRLDHLIATLRKPYVALMDGITMGGGVGLSVHAPLRVATERTVFAMPETTIGFFPDVGGSFFLPRCLPSPACATYLAMTSERLTGADVYYSGVATHYLHSTSLPALEARLAELRFADSDPLRDRLAAVAAAVEEQATGLPHDKAPLLSGELRAAVDRCFDPRRHSSVADIIKALESENATPQTKEWATKTLATLRVRSPTSVHVALRQMQLGPRWTLAETFQREFELAKKLVARPDFSEGVEARLVRKPPTDPVWNPSTLEEVSPETVDELFTVGGGGRGRSAAAENDISMQLLDGRVDFSEYPFPEFGRPSEQEVLSVAREGTRTADEVVRQFVNKWGGKQGVDTIVREIVERRTAVGDSGKVEVVQ